MNNMKNIIDEYYLPVYKDIHGNMWESFSQENILKLKDSGLSFNVVNLHLGGNRNITRVMINTELDDDDYVIQCKNNIFYILLQSLEESFRCEGIDSVIFVLKQKGF